MGRLRQVSRAEASPEIRELYAHFLAIAIRLRTRYRDRHPG